MDLIRKYINIFSDTHEYLGWRIKRLSTRIFKKMNIVELFILQHKIICGWHKIDELLREFIKNFIRNYTLEAFSTPKVVRYYHHEKLQNMTLTEQNPEGTMYSWLTYIESHLRH